MADPTATAEVQTATRLRMARASADAIREIPTREITQQWDFNARVLEARIECAKLETLIEIRDAIRELASKF